MISHAELVQRAAKWLRGTERCGVVLTEHHSASPEIPDAIGWRSTYSVLVECKTSRADFYADKRKPGRSPRFAGIGRYRYYMSAPGILSPDLVREHRPKWGLLEVQPRCVRVLLRAEHFDLETAWREIPLLYSYARRIDQYGLSLDEAQRVIAKAVGHQIQTEAQT